MNNTVRPDAKGRIALGDIAKNVSSYKITLEDNGRVVLDPYMEVPFSEKWIFEDKDLLDKVIQQIVKENSK